MRVLLGMSGGVDSSYAAIRLREMGCTVEGAVIKMHEHTECDGAASVAKALGIPLHIIDGTEQFSSIVKRDFVREYSSGRTPNPCIICNERVKFKLLYDYAVRRGFDRIATGHYASIRRIEDEYGVRHAVGMTDSKKDQSYMLYRLPEEILSALLLPLSDMNKDGVREGAREAGLSVSEKKDSMEICFLPNGAHYEYVERALGDRLLGNFVSEDGKILGRHEGICRYTVGQRKGLGISLGERAFVTDIDPISRNITLSESFAGARETRISSVVFTGLTREQLLNESASADGEYPYFVRVRYTAPLERCAVSLLPSGEALIRFSTDLRIAKGQSAVVYKDGCVMLGGIIEG